MACLDMYNSEHKGSPMSPRISFSNDFVDTQQILKQSSTRESSSPPASSSSDFEFSVTKFSMMSADELFFKGRLLPYKDSNKHSNSNQMQRTIRDELLVGDDDDDNKVSLRPPKGSSTRWKGLLGLKRSHIGSKKLDKVTGCYVDRAGPESRRPPVFGQEDNNHHVAKTSQENLSEGGASCRDVEVGI